MRLCGISSRFQLLSPCTRQVTNALLTRPPLSMINHTPFDLHVLSTPPALILSQDRTLMFKFVLSQYFMILAVLISFPLLFKSLFVLNNSLKAFQKAFA